MKEACSEKPPCPLCAGILERHVIVDHDILVPYESFENKLPPGVGEEGRSAGGERERGTEGAKGLRRHRLGDIIKVEARRLVNGYTVAPSSHPFVGEWRIFRWQAVRAE